RNEKVHELLDDVRRVLREARGGLTQAAVRRGDNVEVRIREADLERALAILNEWLAPTSNGAKPVARIPVAPCTRSVISLTSDGSAPLPPHVTINAVGDGLVRLGVTEAAILDRMRGARQYWLDLLRRRLSELGTVDGMSIEPRGSDRIAVVAPGIDLTR